MGDSVEERNAGRPHAKRRGLGVTRPDPCRRHLEYVRDRHRRCRACTCDCHRPFRPERTARPGGLQPIGTSAEAEFVDAVDRLCRQLAGEIRCETEYPARVAAALGRVAVGRERVAFRYGAGRPLRSQLVTRTPRDGCKRAANAWMAVSSWMDVAE